jgi:hypothetical protein
MQNENNGNGSAWSSKVSAAAMDYAMHGWRVVPCYGLTHDGICECKQGSKCERSSGKHPRILKWQIEASADEETIIGWWSAWPTSNVGVVLGEASGLIDLEYDSEEGRQSLLKLFDGNVPVTPQYESGRGRHHLFRWHPDLPKRGTVPGATIGLPGIDIKLGGDEKGSQSVFPPSRHRDRPEGYRWVEGLSYQDCEVAELPEWVVARLSNWTPGDEEGTGKKKRPKEHWDRLLGGVPEGERNESATSLIGKLLRMGTDEALNDDVHMRIIYESAKAINSRNSPPLAEEELHATFESILKAEQNRRAADRERTFSDSPAMKADIASGIDKKAVRGMSLIIVQSDPQVYELHTSRFKNGFISLTAEDMCSFHRIRVQALEQGNFPIAADWSKEWNKAGGIYERLIFSAVERKATSASRRDWAIVERIYTILARARILQDGQLPDLHGRPCKLDDGSITFGFRYLFDELSMSPDKVRRQELSRAVDRFVSTRKHFGGRDGNRLYVITPQQFEAMRTYVETD